MHKSMDIEIIMRKDNYVPPYAKYGLQVATFPTITHQKKAQVIL